MKFISSTIKCYLILFMLVSSTFISIHSESLYRKATKKAFLSHKSKSSTNAKSFKKFSTIRWHHEESIAIKIYEFTMGMLSTLPVFDEHVEKIEEILQKNDKCSKEEIVKAYDEGVSKRMEGRFLKAAEEGSQLDLLKSNMPWRPSNSNISKMEQAQNSNPKLTCELIVQEHERQMKEITGFRTSFRGARHAAARIRRDKISFEKFKDSLPGFFGSLTASDKENDNADLVKYLSENFLGVKDIDEIETMVKNKKIIWLDTINDVYKILKENHMSAQESLKQLEGTDHTKIDCSQLPEDKIYEKNNVMILDRMAGGWSALKYMGKCVLESLPNQAMEAFKEHVTEFIKSLTEDFLIKIVSIFSSMITKIISLFYEKALSLVWWAMKVIYYVYKGINPDEGESALNFWGKAAGGSIRLVYIAFSPVGTRRRKLIRKRKY